MVSQWNGITQQSQSGCRKYGLTQSAHPAVLKLVLRLLQRSPGHLIKTLVGLFAKRNAATRRRPTENRPFVVVRYGDYGDYMHRCLGDFPSGGPSAPSRVPSCSRQQKQPNLMKKKTKMTKKNNTMMVVMMIMMTMKMMTMTVMALSFGFKVA